MCDGNLLAESNRRYQDYAGRGLFFKLIMLLIINLPLDAPVTNQFFFQEPTSPFMEQLVDFHNSVLFLAVTVFIFVFLMVCRVFLGTNLALISVIGGRDMLIGRYSFTHHRSLELV